MSWEAANAPKRRRLDAGAGTGNSGRNSNDGSLHHNSPSSPMSPRRRRDGRGVSSETVEAALSRLSKAYNTSMECIGASQKTDQMIQKRKASQQHPPQQMQQLQQLQQQQHAARSSAEEEEEEKVHAMQRRVSKAARTTLETSILMDPLILSHVPTLHQTLVEVGRRGGDENTDKDTAGGLLLVDDNDPRRLPWVSRLHEQRRIPPTINSAAHKATLRELAYLSLVNYSDLLQSCGPSPIPKKSDATATTTATILLDRGIVPRLKSVPLDGCWSPDEYAVETQRLVVSALCDASVLDGSDPVLWLKLACASRRLEAMVAAANNDSDDGRGMTTVLRSKHRRLQRYALEQGVTALPSHMPPNRTVVRALDEFHHEPEPEEYISAIPLSPEEQRTRNSKTLELTRYSWSVLARMIIRACKGDETVAAGGAGSSQLNLFGSPTMIVRISPMLALPSRVLGNICLYLDNRSIWSFEATCRALSVSIIAARAVTAQSSDQQQRRASLPGPSIVDDQPKKQQQQSKQANSTTKSTVVDADETNEAKESDKEELRHDSTLGEHAQEEEKTDGGSDVPGRANVPALPLQTSRSEGHRVSKRVRSKEMKSGKKESRVANRNSFDYGFTAATLSCTIEQHNAAVKLVQANPEFKRLFDGHHLWEPSPLQGATLLGRKNVALGERLNAASLEARERVSEASLLTFVTRWSFRNSGPMDLLGKCLAHVALNVEEIFGTESGGQMGLASCLVQCFEILQMRTGSYLTMSRTFFQPVDKTGSLSRTLELFAMDLLYAELLLRQCERDTPTIVEYDDDANTVTVLIPQLVDAAVSLKNSIQADGQDPTQRKILVKAGPLLSRCYWLVAGFYFWRSKIAPSLYVANDAEDEGLWFVQKTIESFDSPLLKSTKGILTPHLASPGRQDACWSEICPSSLFKFRDEIQASSVISEAKQQFEELVLKIGNSHDAIAQSTEVSPDDAVAFAKIGLTLYKRYDSAYGDSDSKLSELVEDVLAVHGRYLLTGSKDEGYRGNKFEIVLVDRPRLEDFTGKEYPSILSMLVSCLTMNPSNRLLVAQLMTRVLLTTNDQYRALLQQIAGSKSSQKRAEGYVSDDAFSDSDDDSVTSDDSISPSRRNDDEKRVRKCIRFILVLTDRLWKLLDSHLEAQEREQFILSNEFCFMIDGTLDVANKWFRPALSHASFGDDDVDRRLFLSVTRLMKAVQLQNCDTGMTDSIFFHGITRIVIRQRAILESLVRSQVDRASRSARQRLCIQRAQFLDPVASEVGLLLSRNLCHVEDFVLKRGSLFEAPSMEDLNKASRPRARALSDHELTFFVYSVRWLWKYSSQVEIESADPIDTANVTSSFDRPIVKTLRIPVATMIVGLCGSACRSRKTGGDGLPGVQKDDPLSLVEFFDSDASCNDWQSDGETEDELFQTDQKKKELLRVICHAVNCIRLVSEPVSDKDAIALALDLNADPSLGPRFPLVASRVLNLFADTLLTAFGGDSTCASKWNSLWAEHHPFQCQDIGDLLDTVLHMHYRWLYGFVLIGEKNHLLSAGKELAHSTNSIVEIEGKRFKLESTVAAAQLYRCIVRAYAGGRRTPPKAALELVKSALPPLKESQTSVEIRRYVFAGDDSYFDLGDIVRLVEKKESWDAPFTTIRDFVCVPENDSIANSPSFEESEAMQVRRGLSRQLANGPIPVDPSDLSSDDARLNTTRHEEEITKKFNYIIDDLCISDATDSEGWYRASQCLTAKSDVIADRLGLNKGFARVSNFSVPELRSSRMRGINIDQLEAEQTAEESQVVSIEYLGKDLSLYANHAWSSFASLKDCSSKLLEDGLRHDQAYPILTGIDSKFEEKHYVDWQEAWGGMFVAALRKLSLRFLCVALYILQSKPDQSFSDAIRMAEMCESIGVAVYSEIMASQNYGYPMRSIAPKRKRDLAMAAKSCFQASVEYVDTSTMKDDASDDRATWDLLFMIGKCHEKIASSFCQEEYRDPTKGISSESRRFEHHMAAALEAYSNALAQAKRIEDDGGQIVHQAGGSAHGSTEVLYRLHTVRLKILIEAVSQNEADLGLAEAEALRLTETYWFRQPNQGADGSGERTVRDRVWEVLADIVAGFVECRKIQPYFHRSVFRHAQALMWSPVLNDPVSSQGSLDTVPATRSVQIRGLNNSTSAAMSAEAIMKTLFDKKRSQLCAVWITTTSASSPFQLLNSTIRKYDSVRGKYIAAYLETLHLCDRRSELEIFMKWLYSSKRDLPAYFQASALAVGAKPAKPQTQDPLLVKDKNVMPIASRSFLLSFKRDANSYLADILTHEMTKKAALSSSESKKTAESYLKHSYACYLRLNCTPQDLKKVRAWKYGASVREVEAICQAFLAMGEKAGMQDTPNFGDWSGGTRKSVIFEAAMAKCRTLYPSLSGNFFSKKATPKPRKVSNSNEASGNTNTQDSTCPPSQSQQHQQEGSFTKMSFEVQVPEGLKPGDSFQTTVNVKDADPVKVKLTIPPGNHSTLRFHVNVQKKMND